MKSIQFSKKTEQVAIVFFILFAVYGIFYVPFTQFLVSIAVGGIVYGITESYEIATVCTIAMNFVFPFLNGRKHGGYEGFESNESSNPEDTIDSSESPDKKEREDMLEVDGVGSKMSEGFEDADNSDSSETKEEVSEAKSKPASVNNMNVNTKDLEKMSGMVKNLVETMNTGDKKISEKLPPANEPQDVIEEKESKKDSKKESKKKSKKESFKDNSGLFKLGEIPKDEKGGNYIDTGPTVMNAINALKPDQIKAMTADTKQLIETQKSLMGMLQTFQPMVSEGRQMMETFQEMFSPTMGASSGAK